MIFSTAFAGEARIIKVLPQLLDKQGRSALSPSLFERDAYQFKLRQNPSEISALRFEIQYKAKGLEGPLLLRLDIRGSKSQMGKHYVFEAPAKKTGWFSSWGRVDLNPAAREEVGEVVAWRASLVQNGVVVATQESFLW